MFPDQTSVVNFLTRSKFFGTYYSSIHTMDGFGVYTFPDQSEYRGYFQRGLFHGFGCLTILSPSKMLIKGQFIHGRLFKVENIIFSDGLHLDCTNEQDFFNKENWKYCINEDRRYTTEISKGLEAVGPNAHITIAKPSLQIKSLEYDTEEGIFNPSSGFLFCEQPHEFRSVFVNCIKEKNWIRKHCRRGPGISLPHVILAEFHRKILNNNLATETNFKSCPCNKKLERKQAICLKCQKNEQPQYEDETTSNVSGLTISSSRTFSLKDNSLNEDVTTFCQDLLNHVAIVRSKREHKSNKNVRISEELSVEPTRLSELWKTKI